MKKINDIKNSSSFIVEPSVKTGIKKFDEWFSRFGGIVLGSSIYVSGTSGAGKTTLMLNIISWLKDEVSVMYSREMTTGQALHQVKDILFPDHSYICDKSDYDNFDLFMKEVYIKKPKVLIIDSLQFIAKEDFAMQDIMSEEKACYEIIKRLREYINENNAVLFLIGHNTKDGNFAGVNTIIQSVDAHIDMVFDKKTNTRIMNWGVKNRKGKMGSLEYFIEDGNILFEQPNTTAPILETNYNRIALETVDFLEKKIDTIKFYRNGNEISEHLITKLKKDFAVSKTKLNKYLDRQSGFYLPEMFITGIVEKYFELIENLEYYVNC